jgi:hypothetical protein
MAEETNSKSTEKPQSSENISIPPIPKPAAGAATGAVLGSVAGPVGAVVGGVIGAIAGKSAATGEPIAETARKAIGLPKRSRSKATPMRSAPRRRQPEASRKKCNTERRSRGAIDEVAARWQSEKPPQQSVGHPHGIAPSVAPWREIASRWHNQPRPHSIAKGENKARCYKIPGPFSAP